MKKKILILGSSSFVAKGLSEKMEAQGFEVDCFSRGKENKINNIIYGDVYDLCNNTHLKNHYDYIINFIVIKDKGEIENIAFIKQLIAFSTQVNVKQLLHFSSIMVYDNNEKYINEYTEIEKNTFKKGYGAHKIAVDAYLESLNNLPFQLSFIRPSYVLSAEREAPFIKKLPFGFTILKGHSKAIMPIVKRDTIHEALMAIVNLNTNEKVYLFLPNGNATKIDYAKEIGHKNIITMPKWLVLGGAKMATQLKLIPKSFFVRIEGMFIESTYDSTKTEHVLKLKF